MNRPAHATSLPAVDWWLHHFDADYLQFMNRVRPPAVIASDVDSMLRTFDAGRLEVESVLDAPCGAGWHAVELSNRGCRVHGVDLSAEMIAAANERLTTARTDARTRCSFEQADLTSWAPAEQFDAAINWFSSIGYSTRADDDLRLLATLRRAVRDGGLLLLETEHLARLRTVFVSTYEVAFGSDCLIAGECSLLDGIYHDRHVISFGERQVERSLRTRIYEIPDLVDLCESSGFVVLDVLDPGSGAPASGDTRALVVACAR